MSASGRGPRLALIFGLWTVIGVAAGVLASVTVPFFFGRQTFTVLSGSMEPVIGTGDVIVVDRISPLDARIGDVVTFRSPEDPDELITHRVRSMEVQAERVIFVTRGDANTGEERWAVSATGSIGRVSYHVPKLGYLLAGLHRPMARIGLIVLPVLLLGLVELRRIWRPGASQGAAAELPSPSAPRRLPEGAGRAS